MKHARADYDRIQDPSGKIPEDEPVMLFRAQDKHFEMVVTLYYVLVERDGGDQKIIDACKAHIERAKAWPIRKAPDMPDTVQWSASTDHTSWKPDPSTGSMKVGT